MAAIRFLLVASLAACAAAPACAVWPGDSGAPPHQDLGAGESGVAYVDDAACAECHAREHAAWSGSHHDLSMQEATAETVLGDFAGATFTHFGVTSRFFTRDGRFFVNTEGPDGRLADFELAYAFGVEPLQQYLAPFPGGRLQSLTIAWDTERGEWIHLYPDELVPPGDPLHWTGRYQRWNVMCAECHSTHVRPNYQVESDTYRTTWAALDVGCQACHGPGGEHVGWARASGIERARAAPAAASRSAVPADAASPGELADGASPAEPAAAASPGEPAGAASPAEPGGAERPVDVGLVSDLGAGADAEVRACAGCHSRRQRLTEVDSHARPFLDDFLPATLDEGLYYPDGQIRDEVYVWGSFVQSRMHAAGVRCSDCHDPHRLGVRAAGDAVCLQCHRETPVERFPTLASARYDSPDHHFHAPDSAGARCVSCHMPARTYMRVDPRRDHGFRIPRPDLSMSLGTPNACTQCHDDRAAGWAAARAAEWWGTPPEPHFAEALAAARAGAPEAEGPLLAVAADGALPAIVRATAVEALRAYGPRALRAIEAAIADADPLLRAAAAGGLDRLPPRRRAAVLAPLLTDPIRAVRIEAARGIAGVARSALTAAQRADYEAARSELVDAQMAVADQPAAHLDSGLLAAREDRLADAEAAYRTALRLDPFFLPARFNLATLLNRLGRNAEAETALRAGIDRAPDAGELYYSLGLLLAEEQRLEEAAASLARAVALVPDHVRVAYNHGLALETLGRLAEAEQAFLEANRRDDRAPDVLLALARVLLRRADLDRAEGYVRELLVLDPGSPVGQRLANEIQLRRLRAWQPRSRQ